MILKIRANNITKNPDLFIDHYRYYNNYGFKKLKDYYSKSNYT